MLKIYLTRHGQDLDNEQGILNGHRDQPLSAIGRNQAKQLASFVRQSGIAFKAVYSSPLQRAYQTALSVTTELEMPEPKVEPLLIERDFGVLSGQKVVDIPKLCFPNILETEKITYFLKASGAESFPDLIIRAKELIKKIKDKHQDGNILLVGHGDFGKMIYAAYYDLPWESVLKSFHFGNSDLILLDDRADPEDLKIFNNQQFNP